MKRTFITIIISLILSAAIAVLSAMYNGSIKQNKTLRAQVTQQSAIIDSLLARKTYNFEVKLNVTDRSRNNIYGRYNKGTIEMPSVKTYILQLDSVSLQLLDGKPKAPY